MSTQDLSPEQIKATDQIIKLLNLAEKAGTPEEAASAAAKAQELLTKHNLDAAMLENPKAIKREKADVEGGSYAFERDLWRAVAELNFCVYFNQQYLGEARMADHWIGNFYVGRRMKQQKQRRHRVVGRIVNTRTTIAMASYLRKAIERQLDARLPQSGESRQSNWAWSFRKGCAATIVRKLKDRRSEVLEQEKNAIARAMKEAAAAASSGISEGTALTVATFSKSEKEANDDFIHGEGFTARVVAIRIANAIRDKAMEDAYTIWAAANPKEAMSKFRWKDPEDGRVYHYTRPRNGGGPGSRGGSTGDSVDYYAFKAGQRAGEDIGLDQQAEDRKGNQTRITGSKDIQL